MAASSSSTKEEDKFSRLSCDLIEYILERLPIREAVRTSALSRSWRYNWVSMKIINLDTNFSCSLKNLSAYGKIVHDIMVQHGGTIQSFSIYPPPYSVKSQHLTKALHIASTKVFQNLSINMLGVFPPPLYSFSQVTNLKINGIQFAKRPPSTLCFPKLIRLDCLYVNFFNDSFDIFMSGCPSLETLTMDSCGPTSGVLSKFNICSASLKHLEVYAESGPVFDIGANNLETLSATPPRSEDSPLRIVAPLNSLKKLVLSCIFLEINDGASFLLPIILGLPSLVELDIETSMMRSTKNVEQVMESKEGSKKKKMLEQLQFVKFTASWGLMEPELFILKFLLARSPSLEKMVIGVLEHSDRDTMNVNSELIGYERASPDAHIVFTKI